MDGGATVWWAAAFFFFVAHSHDVTELREGFYRDQAGRVFLFRTRLICERHLADAVRAAGGDIVDLQAWAGEQVECVPDDGIAPGRMVIVLR